MNVRELIAKLQQFDGDIPVMLCGMDGGGYSDGELTVEVLTLVPVNTGYCTHIELKDCPDGHARGLPIAVVTIT